MSGPPAVKVSSMKDDWCGIGEGCREELRRLARRAGSVGSDIDLELLRLVKCLSAADGKEKPDPDLMAIQLDLIITLSRTIVNNDELRSSFRTPLASQEKHSSDGELLLEVLPDYCHFFSEGLYADFVRGYLGTDAASQRAMSANRGAFRKVMAVLETAQTADGQLVFYPKMRDDRLTDVVYYCAAIMEYAHRHFTYAAPASSVSDLINSATTYRGSGDRGQRMVRSARRPHGALADAAAAVAPPYRRTERPWYQYGCNCFCSTLFCGCMLRLLAKNGRLGPSFTADDVVFVYQWSAESCGENHIYAAVRYQGTRGSTKLDDYFLLETTLDFSPRYSLSKLSQASDPRQAADLINHTYKMMQVADSHLKKYRDVSHFIPLQDTYVMVLDNYLKVVPEATKTWKKYYPQMFEHPLLADNIVDSEDVPLGQRVRLMRQLITNFPRSEKMWQRVITAFRRHVVRQRHELNREIAQSLLDIQSLSLPDSAGWRQFSQLVDLFLR